MKYLLDTHALIWALTETKRLPQKTKAVLEDPRNQFFVSAVSLWEMAIKIRSGRLEAVGHWNDAVAVVEAMGFETIPLLPDEAATSKSLTEDTHFDPFDRMLIWQAISRKMTLISRDPEFKKFAKDGLKLLWK